MGLYFSILSVPPSCILRTSCSCYFSRTHLSNLPFFKLCRKTTILAADGSQIAEGILIINAKSENQLHLKAEPGSVIVASAELMVRRTSPPTSTGLLPPPTLLLVLPLDLQLLKLLLVHPVPLPSAPAVPENLLLGVNELLGIRESPRLLPQLLR